jgi:4'-phosphopantetheinyl transferase
MPTIEVHLANVEVSLGELVRCDAVLSPQERARRDQFVFEADRQLFSLAHGMARFLLADRLRLDPVHLEILVDPDGRPYVNEVGIDFNISHTRGAAVVAMAFEGRVGVDVERIDRPVESLLRGSKILSPVEQQDVDRLPGPERGRRFLEYWVLKESLLKGLGEGLSRPPAEMEFALGAEEEVRILGGLAPEQRWRSWLLQDFPGYLVGLAGEGDPFEVARYRWPRHGALGAD